MALNLMSLTCDPIHPTYQIFKKTLNMETLILWILNTYTY